MFANSLWIFLSILAVPSFYLSIYVYLRRCSKKTSGSSSHPGVALIKADHNPAFLIYPIVYVICNLPLAAARFLRMVHVDISSTFMIIAGVLVSLSGFFDVLVFGITRQSIVFGSTDKVEDKDIGLSTFKFTRTPRTQFGNAVWIEGAAGQHSPEESWEGIGGWWQSFRERATMGSVSTQGVNDSQEVLRRGESNDMAIRMDIITTVQVEVNRPREHDAQSAMGAACQSKRSEDSSNPPPSLGSRWYVVCRHGNSSAGDSKQSIT